MQIEDAKWAKIEKFERFESEMIKSLKVLYISFPNQTSICRDGG
jgi:hypothetical protein